MTLKFHDGRVLSGTQLQIVRQMRQLDYDTDGELVEYVERLVRRAAGLGYDIKPTGGINLDLEQTLAENLIAEMLRVGLVERAG